MMSKKAFLYLSFKKTVKKIKPLWHLGKRIRSGYRYVRFGIRRFADIDGPVHYNDQSLVHNDSNHYNQVGRSALENIQHAMNISKREVTDILHVLDFPCGYGRVLRKLVRFFPRAKIDACDIDPGAIRFCANTFGATPVRSSADIAAIRFPNTYDLIWIGSLLTHLDRIKFVQVIQKAALSLKTHGLLLFSTHGIQALERLHTYGIENTNMDEISQLIEKDGFFYTPYPGENDYGISISPENTVLAIINQECSLGLSLLFYEEKGWDNHQDVFAFQKK